jgi:Leucine-rich repeat (LRR) protein
MSLEATAVAVGKAVGAHLATAWLDARSAEEERSADLVGLIRARFPDRIARRRFERQIADIADQVAERLLSLCASEYRGLSKNDKAAALAEVVQALTSADLSDRALWSADMDGMRLASQIRGRLPALRVEAELGEAGARVYDVVLDECCDCLVRIVLQLPQFGPRASAEMLARMSGVADQVSLVLTRLPVRSLDAPEGTASDNAFRRRYLEHLSMTLDVLELFGVRIERYRPRTTLSVAYISLSVSANSDTVTGFDRRHFTAGRALHIDEWRKSTQEPEEATVQVEAALARAPLSLIRGEAGSGKSTLINWLAISAARRSFSGDLAGWNGCVPFLVKLRAYVGQSLPRPEHFLEGVAGPIAGQMPTGWVHRELRGGRALLLVDGVDELPGSQRRAIRQWLTSLLAEFPGLRVVVTSRPAAAGSDWLAAEGFATAFLERMKPSDVRELIRHWHEAIRDAGDLPCAPEELPGFEAALLARLESAPHLRALAASPLLAAMLCALNLDRVKQLPRDRMGLYAAALELLLEKRDAIRQIGVDREVTLERPQKMQVLQDLAWRLSVTGRAELPRDAVVRWTADKLAAMPTAPTNAGAVLDYLLERSGVLREPAAGRIDFVHRTVQEYLTAKQFTDDGDLEPLLTQAHKDQWRETIIMAAGHANAPQRAELLAGLLRRIGAEPRNARQLRLLAAGCLETLPAIPVDLRDEIEGCVADLIPPRDLASARSLSNVGAPVLDRLPRTPATLTAASSRAVVRTAWLINGPAALELLSGYGADPREDVQEELIRGWEYFDAELYARRVLADAPLVNGHVSIPARLLIAARHLRNLRSLISSSSLADSVADLSFLHDFTQPLTSLFIQKLRSGDLSPLAACAGTLETLSINSATNIEDRAPICKIPNLKHLYFYVPDIVDIGFVRNLPELRSLQLRKLTSVTDFTPLQAQTALATLSLDDCPALTQADSLPPCSNLIFLSLTRSALTCRLQDVVDRAPQLESLYVSFSPWVKDLAPITSLRLRSLGLWDCDGITDFTPLAEMHELDYLDLEGTRIQSLAPIGHLAKLKTLWLRGCADIKDLSPLAPLKNLQNLYIGGVAPMIDLAPLAASSKIRVFISRDQEVLNREMLGRRVQGD